MQRRALVAKPCVRNQPPVRDCITGRNPRLCALPALSILGFNRTERHRASLRNRPRQKPAPIICRSRKAMGEELSQQLSRLSLSPLSGFSIGNTGLTPGAIGAPPSNLHSDAFAIQPLGAFDGSRIPMRPHECGDQAQSQSGRDPFQHQLIVVGRGAYRSPMSIIGTTTANDTPGRFGQC
jgi:hypothetical protein